MVMEFYDLMVLIWGGAPSTEPLSFGAQSAGQAEESQEQGVDISDNKRKHMERQLSVAQRDKLLMQESKEEKEFRKDLSSSLKESNNIFAESMKAMNASMMAIASSMQRSFEHSAAPQYINHMAPPIFRAIFSPW
ncbi:Hypothetical predicted protein [Paramuricea clavata]|uniref:Uncharacterized protein n=1 Tax=Paramuricea clavata TaxID=317549 RepID=A0A6S7HU49_PARCT|nr:Hypothetical predicted protein [Paramuricea clavata]